jgi:hypothetical protein
VEVKASKTVLPAQVQEYLAIEIDTVDEVVRVAPDKVRKYREQILAFLKTVTPDMTVNRRELASLVGKLQFCAPLIERGQERLTHAYWARQQFTDQGVNSWSAKQQWKPNVRVYIDQQTRIDLKWWFDSLKHRNEGKRVYLSEDSALAGLWTGQLPDSDEDLDKWKVSCLGIEVLTTDASGTAGGAWWRDKRYIHVFRKEDGPQYRSSNWREMATIYHALRVWGHHWKSSRLLVRTDNSTCVNNINKRRTKSPVLKSLYAKLAAAAARHSIDLVARHIPGKANVLSDRLSRMVTK